ncbi:MAG TPA: hypothetical protein VGJ15_10965 [Pirellulales bacterium]
MGVASDFAPVNCERLENILGILGGMRENASDAARVDGKRVVRIGRHCGLLSRTIVWQNRKFEGSASSNCSTADPLQAAIGPICQRPRLQWNYIALAGFQRKGIRLFDRVAGERHPPRYRRGFFPLAWFEPIEFDCVGGGTGTRKKSNRGNGKKFGYLEASGHIYPP